MNTFEKLSPILPHLGYYVQVRLDRLLAAKKRNTVKGVAFPPSFTSLGASSRQTHRSTRLERVIEKWQILWVSAPH